MVESGRAKGLIQSCVCIFSCAVICKKGKNCLQACICTVLSDYFLVHVHWITHTVLSKSDCPPYRGCMPSLLMPYIIYAQIRSNPTKHFFSASLKYERARSLLCQETGRHNCTLPSDASNAFCFL